MALTASAEGQVDSDLLVILSEASSLLAESECGINLSLLEVALVASDRAGLSGDKAKVINAALDSKSSTLWNIALSPIIC